MATSQNRRTHTKGKGGDGQRGEERENGGGINKKRKKIK